MNMPIFYVGGSKGGVGKSKLTFALVDYLLDEGKQVLLLHFPCRGYIRLTAINVITIADHCPRTVATAAPAIPMQGEPNKPKIKIGSRIIFITAPTICAAIGSAIFPLACRIFVQIDSTKMPSEPANIMFV